jgi:hypothetical protein
VGSIVPDEPDARSKGLDRLLGRIEPDVARLLERVLEGRELSSEGGLRLALTRGSFG